MSPLEDLDRRYNADPTFRAITQMLENALLALRLSPHELREAAMYAAYRAESRRIPNIALIVKRAEVDAALLHPEGKGLRDALLGWADALEEDEERKKR